MVNDSKPWDNTPSIWDGWTDEMQCKGKMAEYRISKSNGPLGLIYQHPTGRVCALGFVAGTVGIFQVHERLRRVSLFLSPGDGYKGITASNDTDWTPEMFRDLDRRLEWEHTMKLAARFVDGIEVEALDVFDEV